MPKFADLTNQSFGRLFVVGPAPKSNHAAKMWECICICGNYKNARSDRLIGGFAQSCGCFMRQMAGHRLSELRHRQAYPRRVRGPADQSKGVA